MSAPTPQAAAPLVSVVGLQKSYSHPSLWSGNSRSFKALDDVSFDLVSGSCTVLVGSSGSGKTTLAMCLARLEEVDSGEIRFAGMDLALLQGEALRRFRPRLQLVLQDASGSLNPRFTAAELVEEPLLIQRIGKKDERRERATKALQELGIPRERHGCRADEFSGGQRRRIGLARALVLDPQLMILDEVFSGLDLATSAHILQLLLDVRAKTGLTLLFISHDLSLLAGVADSVIVMQGGKMVEQGSPQRLTEAPQHPHTSALFRAIRELQSSNAQGAGL